MASRFKLILELIEELIEEFLSISLLSSIGWLSIPLFEGVAEFCWVDKGSLRQLQEAEEVLQLAQQVVIKLSLLVLDDVLCCLILHLQKAKPERRDHEELLQH